MINRISHLLTVEEVAAQEVAAEKVG